MVGGPGFFPDKVLGHPIVDHFDAATFNDLLSECDESPSLEEGPGCDARFREQRDETTKPGLGLDLRQYCLPNTAALMVGVDVEMIEMSVVLEVGKPGDATADLGNQREPAGQAESPSADVDIIRRPGFDLLRCVVPAVNASDRIAEERDNLSHIVVTIFTYKHRDGL
jgi:hypothetical protein